MQSCQNIIIQVVVDGIQIDIIAIRLSEKAFKRKWQRLLGLTGMGEPNKANLLNGTIVASLMILLGSPWGPLCTLHSPVTLIDLTGTTNKVLSPTKVVFRWVTVKRPIGHSRSRLKLTILMLLLSEMNPAAQVSTIKATEMVQCPICLNNGVGPHSRRLLHQIGEKETQILHLDLIVVDPGVEWIGNPQFSNHPGQISMQPGQTSDFSSIISTRNLGTVQMIGKKTLPAGLSTDEGSLSRSDSRLTNSDATTASTGLDKTNHRISHARLSGIGLQIRASRIIMKAMIVKIAEPTTTIPGRTTFERLKNAHTHDPPLKTLVASAGDQHPPSEDAANPHLLPAVGCTSVAHIHETRGTAMTEGVHDPQESAEKVIPEASKRHITKKNIMEKSGADTLMTKMYPATIIKSIRGQNGARVNVEDQAAHLAGVGVEVKHRAVNPDPVREAVVGRVGGEGVIRRRRGVDRLRDQGHLPHKAPVTLAQSSQRRSR